MQAHVSYLREDCDACLVMLTTERDIFFELSEAKTKILQVIWNQLTIQKDMKTVPNPCPRPWIRPM